MLAESYDNCTETKSKVVGTASNIEPWASVASARQGDKSPTRPRDGLSLVLGGLGDPGFASRRGAVEGMGVKEWRWKNRRPSLGAGITVQKPYENSLL